MQPRHHWGGQGLNYSFYRLLFPPLPFRGAGTGNASSSRWTSERNSSSIMSAEMMASYQSLHPFCEWNSSVACPDCVSSRHYLISELLFPGSQSCLFAACVTCVRQQLEALMLSVHPLLPISHNAVHSVFPPTLCDLGARASVYQNIYTCQ